MAERINRSIAERPRCLRFNAGLAKNFWENVVSMTSFLINRSLRASLDGKVVEEVWTSNEVDFTDILVFGCPSYVHIPREERSKLDPKSKQQCIFLGYEKGVKGYKLWDLKTSKVVISRDVVFNEKAILTNTQNKEEQLPERKRKDKQVVEVELQDENMDHTLSNSVVTT